MDFKGKFFSRFHLVTLVHCPPVKIGLWEWREEGLSQLAGSVPQTCCICKGGGIRGGQGGRDFVTLSGEKKKFSRKEVGPDGAPFILGQRDHKVCPIMLYPIL